MEFARSFLFVPGNRERMLIKSKELDCDVVIFDLEDAVGENNKAYALSLVSRVLSKREEYPMRIGIRVNPDADQELAELSGLDFDILVLPKAELSTTYNFFAAIEKHAITQKVLLIVETARGLVECYESLGVSSQVCGAMLGAEDLSADIGFRRTPEGGEIAYARSVLAVACAARRLLAVDTPNMVLGDAAALQRDTETAKALGMKAKAAIHPNQLSVIHNVFSPTKQELERARQLLALYESNGHNVFRLGMEMIDTPIIRRAQSILSRATL